MPEFDHLWPLLVIPFAWLAACRSSIPERPAVRALYLPQAGRLASLPATPRGPWRGWPRALVLTLILLALSAPHRVDERTAGGSGRAIVLAIDVSGSMRALSDSRADGQALSRLDLVRSVGRRLVARHPGDRFGIVTFADEAIVYLPLTDDTRLVGRLLDELGPGMLGERTALGEGIALACRLFDGVDTPGRAVILFSDGRNTTGALSPAMGRRIAQAMKIPVYAIAIGRSGKVAFPQGPVAPPVAAELPPDPDTLAAIARTTGGRVFAVNDLDRLDAVIDRIDRRELATGDSTRDEHGPVASPWLLLASLALLLYEAWRHEWSVAPR